MSTDLPPSCLLMSTWFFGMWAHKHTHTLRIQKKKLNLSPCMPLRCGASCHHNKIQSVPANTKHSPLSSLIFWKARWWQRRIGENTCFFSLCLPVFTPHCYRRWIWSISFYCLFSHKLAWFRKKNAVVFILWIEYFSKAKYRHLDFTVQNLWDGVYTLQSCRDRFLLGNPFWKYISCKALCSHQSLSITCHSSLSLSSFVKLLLWIQGIKTTFKNLVFRMNL